MARICIDDTRTVGRIKPLHAGGQPPLLGSRTTCFHYLTEAGIPYSRLHDVGGLYGGGRYVDIPNLFRNFDADETDPQNYDFTFTDHLISALIEAGVEPYFRLGITIENYADIKYYHAMPPKDYEKWARICEHIVAHYNEGWADGFRYNITYWEIWNEPDNKRNRDAVSEMWNGTPEEYYRLYDVTAKHLKKCFPNIKVGGYASCGFYYLTAPQTKIVNRPNYEYFMEFFYGFFEYVKEHGSPIDFFSWHSYDKTENTLIWANWLGEKLKEFGYGHIESHLNEWDPFCKEFGTAHHSAEIAAMMLGMQNTHVSLMCIYDMRITNVPYCPLFDVITQTPIHGYYSMVAFNHLYRLGTQVKLTCDTKGLYAVAATNGKKNALMISNLTGEEQILHIEGVDLSDARISVIDEKRLLSWAPAADKIGNNTVLLIEY